MKNLADKTVDSCSACEREIMLPRIGECWINKMNGAKYIIDGKPKEGEPYWHATLYNSSNPKYDGVGKRVALWYSSVRNGEWQRFRGEID